MSQNLTTLPSDDSGLSIVSPVNLGLSLTHSLSVGVNIPLTGWLRLSAHIYGYYASNRYGTMSYDDWHAEVYTSLMFAVLSSMGAQLSLSGSSPTAGLESHSGDSYGLSGSIYKTFFRRQAVRVVRIRRPVLPEMADSGDGEDRRFLLCRDTAAESQPAMDIAFGEFPVPAQCS